MPEFSRLPKTIKPVHYKLDLTPNLTDFSIKGHQVVSLDVKETCSEIKLNCLDIKITSAVVNEAKLDVDTQLTYDEKNEAITFALKDALQAGSKATLTLDFDAVLNDKLKGFYRSTYMKDGEKKICGVTQFESTDARRCFPCWDEPAVKSTFECSLTIPKGQNLTALSNMPVTSETDVGEDMVKYQYASSPIMSTYLLAFYVGESEFVSGKTKNGVEVRVFTPLGKKSHGEFALDMGIKCLEYYEDYFDIKFPLPKCDQIGLDDFSAGAMENWGLVTYRSTCLLIDPENSSTQTKQRVAIVVAHELAHQWFGNLVTMEWWTHLWLNEGFASFMEYLSTDAIYPEYNIFDTFVKDDFSMGMSLDALDTSHPIEVPVNHPSEVDEIFDHISYCKGSSTIRMLHSWIGDAAFRKGMAAYLNKHAYSNTLTEDLWAALEAASGMPVGTVMSSWTSQMGFPLVKVELVEGTETKLKISQQKFSANGPAKQSDQIWQIPIEICSADSPTKAIKKLVLTEKEQIVELDGPSAWFKLNCGTVGFYRVQYDAKMAAALKVNALVTRDRLQLQSDTFALAKAGYIPITDYLDMLSLYTTETDYAVLADILVSLSDISKVCWNLDEATRDNFRKWRLAFLQHAKQHVGFDKVDGESHGNSLLRSGIISCCGGLGDPEVVEWCSEKFAKHCAGSELIAGDLRGAVFGVMAGQAKSTDTIDQLMKLWKDNEASQEEQQHIERSMGCVKTQENIDKVAKWIIEDVKTCNKPFTFVGLCNGSIAGCDATWNYTKNNIESVRKEFSGFLRQAMVARTFQAYGTTARHDELKEFFAANPIEGAERAIPQMLEKIAGRAAILERDGDNIKNYAWHC